MFQILNGSRGTLPGWDTWDVPTGISWPDHLVAYPWYNYSYMSGDRDSGEIGIGNYIAADLSDTGSLSWCYDVFTWGTVVEGPLTIDDLIGLYHSSFEYIENDSFTNWTDESYTSDTDEAVIEFEDNTHVSLDGFMWSGCPVVGEYNADAMTITFPAQLFGAVYADGAYYSLGDTNDINGSLIATVTNSRSLHMENVGIWYTWSDGSTWCCYRGTLDMQFLSDGSTSAPRRLAPVQPAASRKTAAHKNAVRGKGAPTRQPQSHR